MTADRSVRRGPAGQGFGVLAPLSAVPGGKGPRTFADGVRFAAELAELGFDHWQLLPVLDTGARRSPYSPMSAYALDPRLYSVELASQDPALHDLAHNLVGSPEDQLAELCRRANGRLRTDELPREVHDWALHRAIASRHGATWQDWPAAFRDREPGALARTALDAEVRLGVTTQAVLWRQWSQLQLAAAQSGVRLIADLPFCIQPAGSDAWACRDAFALGPDGSPTALAGVPPTVADPDGQVWKLLPYSDTPAAQRYWTDRLRWWAKHVDGLRLDHFSGFARMWGVPPGAHPRAGRWQPGPGFEVARLTGTQVIAEDLGASPELVRPGVAQVGALTTRVITMALAGDPDHAPAAITERTALYSSTHDTDTLVGTLKAGTRAPALIAEALAGPAALVLIALPDLLALGSEARLNVPGKSNDLWGWRAAGPTLAKGIPAELRAVIEAGRG